MLVLAETLAWKLLRLHPKRSCLRGGASIFGAQEKSAAATSVRVRLSVVASGSFGLDSCSSRAKQTTAAVTASLDAVLLAVWKPHARDKESENVVSGVVSDAYVCSL